MDKIINVADVSFAYRNKPVLENVQFSVQTGEFLTIVGPNGGGKTTLAKLLLGLLEPQKGFIEVLGKRISACQIGYLPQEINLDRSFPISTLEMVLLGRLGISKHFIKFSLAEKTRAREVLSWVGLSDMLKVPVFKLSGGQLQRALIARALVSDPKILLLDEPVSHLDPTQEKSFFDLLAELNRLGLTILVISHDLSFVSPYVERVICVNREVEVHPVGDMVPELINHLYGQPMRPILHHLSQCEHHKHG